VRNDGPTAVRYDVSTTPSAQSKKARILLSNRSITVPAGGSAKVLLIVAAAAKDVKISVVAE
jgi:hypothetical protein